MHSHITHKTPLYVLNVRGGQDLQSKQRLTFWQLGSVGFCSGMFHPLGLVVCGQKEHCDCFDSIPWLKVKHNLFMSGWLINTLATQQYNLNNRCILPSNHNRIKVTIRK